MIVRFLALAEAELEDAVAYYDAQMPKLGTEFARQVQLGLERIVDFPDAWQILGKRVRRYRLSRFPYGILYAVVASEIVVVAIMHLHRLPEYWTHRLQQL